MVELAVAMGIAAMQGTEVEPPIGAGALLESGHQVEMDLARAIDLATREIAVVEIGLAVATWEVVLGIEASSEMVADSAAAVRGQAAVEVLPVWVVRVGEVLAELAVAEAEVVADAGSSETAKLEKAALGSVELTTYG